MRSFHYPKVISAIMSAAVLVGLAGVMTTMPAWAETTCHRDPQNEGASAAEKCVAPARDKTALRAAHAQITEPPEKQRTAAAHCVAARGLPTQRGPWQFGIDRATGHRCWRLVGAIKGTPGSSSLTGTPRLRSGLCLRGSTGRAFRSGTCDSPTPTARVNRLRPRPAASQGLPKPCPPISANRRSRPKPARPARRIRSTGPSFSRSISVSPCRPARV